MKEIVQIMKDNFSNESDKYARYRPHYPESLFKWIDKTVVHKDVVWDCATGNGQIGRGVANIFTLWSSGVNET